MQSKAKNLQPKSTLPTFPGSQENAAGFQGPVFAAAKNQQGQYVTQNNFNPFMQQQDTSAQKNVLGLLNNLSQFNQGVGSQGWQNFTNRQAQTYGDLATQQFMRQETPILSQIQSQYNKQFGGGENTMYGDRLTQEMNQTINPALQQISEQAALQAPALTSQYIQNMGSLLGQNQGVSTQNLADFINGIKMAQAGSTVPEQLNISTGVYGSPGANMTPSNPSMLAQILGGVGAVGNIVGNFLP